MENKLIIIIITYNPNISRLKLVINFAYWASDNIYIVDNNSSNFSDLTYLLTQYNKINFTQLNRNMGLAGTFNKFIDQFQLNKKNIIHGFYI